MNTTKIIQKCLIALNESEPDISYIRGMLETIVEMSEERPMAGTTVSVFTGNQKGADTLNNPSMHMNAQNEELTPEQQAVQSALEMAGGMPHIKPGVIEHNVVLNEPNA